MRSLVLALAARSALLAPAGALAASPAGDPFFRYAGSTPLASLAPGTVVNTRTTAYHVAGIPTPIRAVQLAYRSTNERGEAVVNVTSVLRPPFALSKPKLLTYGSFYDSLNPADQPSVAIAGGVSFGGAINAVEGALIAPFLLSGYTVGVPDIEGQAADFAAGPEYGRLTLDAIRATYASPAVGLPAATKHGLLGYSGGAIAAEWAAELAPTYAPDVNAKLVGAAIGGVLVNPARNLHYVEGSKLWAGVMPMAIIGISRAYGVDLEPYLSDNGKRIYARMADDSISQVIGAYPGLTWTKLARPEYPTPESVELYVRYANRLIMGTGGTPTTPLFIGQGNRGDLEGTPGAKPGIGKGDGVMVTGDVRSLARQYCAAGTKVLYREYATSHFGTMLPWFPAAVQWMAARFDGRGAPENCATIAPGNPLTPIQYRPAAAN